MNLEPGARLIRAWVEFARDQVDAALDDLTQLYTFVREADFLQTTLPALALRARVLAAAGRDDDARRDVDELLRLWSERAAAAEYWAADLAFAAVALGCAAEVDTALAGAGETRWVEAARALLRGDNEGAAELFARIGSRPDEAVARLAAAASNGGGAQLERAVEFFRSVRATRYLQEGEQLLSVTS
jgi:hypothetical protein